jgi:succinoglycan biosynthesis transport protein ExoP
MIRNRQGLESPPLRLATDSRAEATDRHVPAFESLPDFEEQPGVATHPGAVVKTVLDDRSLAGEQFRLLGARLRALGRDKRLRRIGVVSAALGEGKTTVALGLARALSLDRQRRVLLLEFDLRRPIIDHALGFTPPEVGLAEYLQGKGDVPVLRRPMPGGFWLLSAGSAQFEKPSVLSSPRFLALLESADRVFDYVIVDCPPLLPVADAVVIQDLLDGFVFVVRSRHSPRETIQRAISVIRPGLVVGLVLNGQRDIIPSYGEYAYRRYDGKARASRRGRGRS